MMVDPPVTAVLLVDDDDDDALLTCDALCRVAPNQFVVTRVRRLDDCLLSLDEGVAQVVLLELTLPDSQGLETTKAVLSRAAGRAVVILSGSADEDLAIASVASGAQDYLIKRRAAPDLLVRSIRHAMNRKSLEGRLERQNALLSELASTDVLTGLHNLRHLREALPAACAEAVDGDRSLSAVLLDLDRFKSYNDAFGHLAGDDILRTIGSILRSESRRGDVVARYGGEEFVVLLPGSDAARATAFAERLRAAIAAVPWPLRAMTASLGVATLRRVGEDEGQVDGEVGDVLIAEADRAMYQAKRRGGDRVVHHDDPQSVGLAPEGRNESSRLAGNPLPPSSGHGGRVVLHVDDDPGYRRVVGRILGRSGLHVVGAPTASEGLVRATHGPDLILLDVRLPDLDGLEACRRLRADERTADIPLLCLSSTMERGEDRARALDAGADAALPKMVDPRELLAVAGALIRSRRGRSGGDVGGRGRRQDEWPCGCVLHVDRLRLAASGGPYETTA